jgi:hypothetical protein
LSRRPEAPSLGVLAVSGLGVLAVLVFVAVLVFGDVDDAPVDRLTAVRSGGPAGLTVIVGRCGDQRVTTMEVATPDGTARWRIASDKGSIERRYVVGADAPVDFNTVVPYMGDADERVIARATIRRAGHPTEIHRATFDVDDLRTEEPDLGASAPTCPDSADIGVVGVLFIAVAAVVVSGYVAMVARAVRARR